MGLILMVFSNHFSVKVGLVLKYLSRFFQAYIYCAVVLVSHGIAFVLVITVEYPCANLEKLLFKRIEKNNRK
jgi:hypothetical protein